jgi:hypothetical protein
MHSPTSDDPVVSTLEKAIHLFLQVKGRYPLLLATSRELERIRTLPNDRPFANDAVLQVLRDSFDMLIIDLYSIRQWLAKDKISGLFQLLKMNPERLHVRQPSTPHPDLKAIVTAQVREAARWLTETDEPANALTVVAMCKRFLLATEPIDRDRNWVRAHRFEHQERDTSAAFIELPDLQEQITIMERYLHDLYLLITHGGFHMDLPLGNEQEFADDFSDLIVHGSISSAMSYYEKAGPSENPPPQWYWLARRQALERLGLVRDQEGPEG